MPDDCWRRLGRFLQHMEKWIYRRYLNRADITGIKAQKRRLHRWEEYDQRDVVNAPEGSAKSTLLFLSLINGGNFSDIRVRGTLPSIYQLQKAGRYHKKNPTYFEILIFAKADSPSPTNSQ